MPFVLSLSNRYEGAPSREVRQYRPGDSQIASLICEAIRKGKVTKSLTKQNLPGRNQPSAHRTILNIGIWYYLLHVEDSITMIALPAKAMWLKGAKQKTGTESRA
ncbi:carboxylesterase, type B [Aspergillus luchuensis]|uniref:Carboxylesterase, type B n=1 Tax=Aspergillus kawachii TaxID=1069201 RepID=A0A146F0R0_ASPKA|nr:carboxylesterase, type B [Aspergillus luchuensis]